MKTLTEAAFAAAERYMLLHARLIDRLQFAHRFRGGPAEPVRSVLRGYQNPDGGFGNAIEPDLRGAGGQPQGVETAFWAFEAIEAFDDPAITGACDWLEAHTAEDGGVPWVLPSVLETERAPWWQPQGDPAPGSLNPTGPITGLLLAHGIEHPWLERAVEFCWDRIGTASELSAYDAMCVLGFLERVPDRERAEAAFERLGDALRAAVALDPDAPGHVHSPLDLAPRPDSMARRLFSDAEIERHLDAVIDAQQEDGGWAPNFEMWTPLVRHEWGGHLTLGQLTVLRDYGRLG